jgi:hypothetical protein
MRVLIVHPSLIFYGGASAAVVHLSMYLNSKGIENEILSLHVTERFLRETKELVLGCFFVVKLKLFADWVI